MANTSTSLLAYGAFAASAVTIGLNMWQALRKRKSENSELSNIAKKALAERDSFVVKGAEGALTMMEKMLTTAVTEVDTLRMRVGEVELERNALNQRILSLEREKSDLQHSLKAVEDRLAELERGGG